MNNHENNMRNLRGTFAVEGMKISRETAKNLERLSENKVTYSKIVDELREKYTQKA